MSELACALLAAGASSRLGRPKQLVCVSGVPLVRHVVQQLMAAECGRVAVVLGCERESIAQALSGSGAELLHNPDWAEGIAASIRVAVRWAAESGCAGLLLAVCDQPALRAAQVRALREAFCAGAGSAVASGYSGRRGVPVLYSRAWFARLLALRGERGAAALLQDDPAVAVVDWPQGAFDLDSPEDLMRLSRRLPG